MHGIYIVFSYSLFITISILRLKFIFVPRKIASGAFNTMSFVCCFFYFLMGSSLPVSVRLFQLLHDLTGKCALTLAVVNWMVPYLPGEFPIPHLYIYCLHSCMRYGELYLGGMKIHWDLSAKDTQDICDRMVKALPKHHALPMKMSLPLGNGIFYFLNQGLRTKWLLQSIHM